MFEILPKRVLARKLVQTPPQRPRMPPRESRRESGWLVHVRAFNPRIRMLLHR